MNLYWWDLKPEVCSWSLSVSTDFPEKYHKHQGDDVHSNVLEFLLLHQGMFDPIFPLVIADFRKLIHCCIEFPTLQVMLVCHATLPKPPFRYQITDLGNAIISWDISLLRTEALHGADTHELGNHPDTLPHATIYPLCVQAAHILPNPLSDCYPLADSKSGILGPEADSYIRHLDCISICNYWFWQPQVITRQCWFRKRVNNWVVDIDWLWLSTNITRDEYMVKGYAMAYLRWEG